MKLRGSIRVSLFAAAISLVSPALIAQNSIQLFSPLDVRLSQSNAQLAPNALTFNTNTLNLTCPASPLAVLSSAASATPSSSNAGLLVDNDLDVTNLTTNIGPQNLCTGVPTNPGQSNDLSCFSSGYQGPAGNGQLNGANPDTLVASGGVPAINITGFLIAGPQQIKVDLIDQGGYVASSSVYLNTNCISGGVVGPAVISGNTVTPTTTDPQLLTQSFTFNPGQNQEVSFIYDLGPAQAADTLTVNPSGVNPQVTDSGIDPLIQFPRLVSGTSFATSACLIHSGEIVNSVPACKLYTLDCTIGTSSSGAGAHCPVSSLPNEVLQDVFDGPPFVLSDISVPNGPTFHQGIGFLEASEGWPGGSCTFDPASGLQNELCPQNLLTSFTGPGLYRSGGQTTHPNSTFISVAQVPEDLTTVTLADGTGNPIALGPGGWTNNPNAFLEFSSQPPYLTGTLVPNASNFVAAPVQSITYGISSGTTPPAVGSTSSTDTVIANPAACPSQPVTSAPVFTAPLQPLNNLANGSYLVHYLAQDCAGTQELKFLQDQSLSWSTNFYTYALNIDTVAPQVSAGPTLSPSGPYFPGQLVTASYSCTDDRSGVVKCGSHTFPAGTLATGPLTTVFPVLGIGQRSFTVTALDAAGNQSSQSVSYGSPVDNRVQFSLSSTQVTYPQGTSLVVKVTPTAGHAPTGTVSIMEGGSTLASFPINGGAAYYYLSGVTVGRHNLYAAYSGDAYNAPGDSPANALTVVPVPVTLALACWNTPYPYGADFFCGVYTSSAAGAPAGVITYSLDGAAASSQPLFFGVTLITVHKPSVGSHSLVINYPAQTNFAAAGPQTRTFSITPAPVYVQFTPSSYYLTGGNLTLSAAVQSWSAGPPNATGSITFSFGNTVLATVPVNAQGKAATTVAAASLPNGTDTLTATYNGGANYASGSTSISIGVAHQ